MAIDDDVRRSGFTVASDLVSRAREDATSIIDEAERRADLIIIKAERAAAAKQSEAEIYLQKARAVLEIAHQRASNRPKVLSLLDVTDRSEHRLDLTDSEPHIFRTTDRTEQPLPPAFDKLLSNAVSSAVASSVASSRTTGR